MKNEKLLTEGITLDEMEKIVSKFFTYIQEDIMYLSDEEKMEDRIYIPHHDKEEFKSMIIDLNSTTDTKTNDEINEIVNQYEFTDIGEARYIYDLFPRAIDYHIENDEDERIHGNAGNNPMDDTYAVSTRVRGNDRNLSYMVHLAYTIDEDGLYTIEHLRTEHSHRHGIRPDMISVPSNDIEMIGLYEYSDDQIEFDLEEAHVSTFYLYGDRVISHMKQGIRTGEEIYKKVYKFMDNDTIKSKDNDDRYRLMKEAKEEANRIIHEMEDKRI